jgi:2-methylcitrate dehydratase PrpD
MSFTGHPSVVLVPALLALAEARGASGAAFMTAFVAGYETLCRIGAAVSPGHYALGFHSHRHRWHIRRGGSLRAPAAARCRTTPPIALGIAATRGRGIEGNVRLDVQAACTPARPARTA